MNNHNTTEAFGTENRKKDTRLWSVASGASADSESAIREAAAMIEAGGTVAFPTETVYGLGADARNTQAVDRIFQAKGRPSDNPLIVHIAGREQLDELVLPYGETARRLMARFWPGPLTLVLPARPGAVSPRVTAGLPTVAVRMPAHDVALRLIAAAGCPVAAPSANRSGRPSPTLAAHVREDLAGRIDGIVDGGPTGVGLESTVVELIGERVNVLRPGGVTPAELREVAGEVTLEPALDAASDTRPEEAVARERTGRDGDAVQSRNAPRADNQTAEPAPRSPGMKYAHYAPRGAMRIVKGAAPERVSAWIQAELDAARRRGERTGVLAFDEHAGAYRADLVVSCGSLRALETAAQRLYAALRSFDEHGIGFILAEACPEEGIGLAVMNRLVKAAGHRIVEV
ncbi:Threonylcarbamoyl-AMP synthase [Paenibacillus sp. CECT 9249]|uniref:L-threonylcarbamoyladenylate synthase n=1 Tax=Paenibacillus sp. CECT 9249 TaxID=2845385 RepID=UPI001EF9BE1D|nr:L-threonylcarbamoyladenylate synthase [Paenibacillus sp. CECT 9249]CAH0118097.1 Threonylcarbamoyl-AMP synthase [Paenibacillus sp. CECT 9249]